MRYMTIKPFLFVLVGILSVFNIADGGGIVNPIAGISPETLKISGQLSDQIESPQGKSKDFSFNHHTYHLQEFRRKPFTLKQFRAKQLAQIRANQLQQGNHCHVPQPRNGHIESVAQSWHQADPLLTKTFLQSDTVNQHPTNLKNSGFFDTDVYFAYNSKAKTAFLITRGSKGRYNWTTNFMAVFVGFDANPCMPVMYGFYEYMNVALTSKQKSDKQSSVTLEQTIDNLIKQHPNTKFVISGHSLGGAVSVLFAAYLVDQKHINPNNIDLVTFGEPAPGRLGFVEAFRAKLMHYVRFDNMGNPRYIHDYWSHPLAALGDPVVHATDIVWGKHFGTEVTAYNYASDSPTPGHTLQSKIAYSFHLHWIGNYEQFIESGPTKSQQLSRHQAVALQDAWWEHGQ